MTIRIDGTNTAANPGITGSDTDTGLQFGTDEVNIVTGGTTRATVDSSGRLLVGTSTARNNFFNSSTNVPQFQIEGTNFNDTRMSLVRNSTDVGGPSLLFGKTKGTAIGDNDLVSNGDVLGLISFQGADGSLQVEGAKIEAYVDGTPGSSDMPGRLVFSTTAAGASSPTERLRITSDGTLQLRNSPGIDFSQIQTNAAGVDGEILDSYEQGTWTPEVSFGGSSTGVTYSEQTGTYVKIGNFVWASIVVGLTNNGTGTGSIGISLPFTSGSEGATRGAGIVSFADNFTSLNSTPTVYMAAASTSTCRFQHLDSSSGSGTELAALTETNVGNTAQWRAAISYTTF